MFAHSFRSKLVVLVVLLIAGLSIIPVMAQDEEDMDPEKNKALIGDFYEAISGKEKPVEVQDQYITESNQALREHIAMVEAAFPLYEIMAEDMIAEGDKVAVRATVRGTHQGEFAGIPPTGKEIEIAGILIYRIEDGNIGEFWMQADELGLLRQLGVLPPG